MTPVAIDCNFVPGAMWQGRMSLIAAQPCSAEECLSFCIRLYYNPADG